MSSNSCTTKLDSQNAPLPPTTTVTSLTTFVTVKKREGGREESTFKHTHNGLFFTVYEFVVRSLRITTTLLCAEFHYRFWPRKREKKKEESRRRKKRIFKCHACCAAAPFFPLLFFPSSSLRSISKGTFQFHPRSFLFSFTTNVIWRYRMIRK